MKKVYISPSSQTANMYSGMTGVSESKVCRKIGTQLYEKLLKILGDSVRIADEKLGYADRVQDSNNFNADYHICIHTNAGGGDGTVMFAHKNSAKRDEILSVYNQVAAVSPGADDGIFVRDNLYEINNTKGLCIYVECEFHDNPELAVWIQANTEILATAIYNGIVPYLDINAMPGDSNTTSDYVDYSKVAYKVICGSFEGLKNAVERKNKLQMLGIHSFIYRVQNDSKDYNRVQVGAFENKEYAYAYADLVAKQTGFMCFVEQY